MRRRAAAESRARCRNGRETRVSLFDETAEKVDFIGRDPIDAETRRPYGRSAGLGAAAETNLLPRNGPPDSVPDLFSGLRRSGDNPHGCARSPLQAKTADFAYDARSVGGRRGKPFEQWSSTTTASCRRLLPTSATISTYGPATTGTTEWSNW